MKLRILLLFALILPLTGLADTAPVKTYTLDNGLKLYVREVHRAPVVFSSIWYKVGSGNEPNGLTGISHMLEHMMFRGTKNHNAGDLEQLVNENGGSQNAMTTNDYTVYYQFMPADKLDLVLQLEADRMQNLLIDDQQFQNERKVVMQERRMRIDNNPQAQLYERLNAAAFVNNPYHHLPIGWMTDIKHYTLADLQAWYETWYVPNNAFIVVVGDVNADQVYQTVNRYFSGIASQTLPSLKPRREIPRLGSKTVNVYANAQQPAVFLAFNMPTLITKKNSPTPYALDILSGILCGDNSSRLQKSLVLTQRVANEIECSYSPLYLHENLFYIYAVPNPPHTIQEVLNSLSIELTKIQTTLVSADELDRVKTTVKAQKIYERDTLQAQAFAIGVPESIGLPWETLENYPKAIDKITAEDLQNAAKTWIKPENSTIGVLNPLPKKSPQGT